MPPPLPSPSSLPKQLTTIMPIRDNPSEKGSSPQLKRSAGSSYSMRPWFGRRPPASPPPATHPLADQQNSVYPPPDARCYERSCFAPSPSTSSRSHPATDTGCKSAVVGVQALGKGDPTIDCGGSEAAEHVHPLKCSSSSGALLCVLFEYLPSPCGLLLVVFLSVSPWLSAAVSKPTSAGAMATPGRGNCCDIAICEPPARLPLARPSGRILRPSVRVLPPLISRPLSLTLAPTICSRVSSSGMGATVNRRRWPDGFIGLNGVRIVVDCAFGAGAADAVAAEPVS